MSVAGIGQSSNVYTPPSANLWGASASAPTHTAVENEFLKWAKMSPGERMRADILSSMGLDADKVAAMSPEEQKKVEDKVREMIEEKLRQGAKKPGLLVDQKA